MTGILFATTLYSSAPLLLNLLVASPAVLVLLSTSRPRSQQKAKPPRQPSTAENEASEKPQEASNQPATLPIHPFLTTYRAAMMVVTCIAILAVDFRVFPRRFAKVENWGTSLMDLGVGSFVFSGGVVSARSVLKRRNNGSTKLPLSQRLIASTRHSIPLLVLGLIRLYSVKGLDYAEHVTEYGVHWNFFFTIGLLPPFVEIFDVLYKFLPYETLAVVVVVIYHIALESTDLKSYILVSPHGPDLLSKNREGIFSFVGYLAIFLLGRGTGVRISPGGTRPPIDGRLTMLVNMGLQVLCWSMQYVCISTYAAGHGSNVPVSRRLANISYVSWVAMFNNAQLFIFCLIETLLFPAVYRGLGKEGEAERTSFATSRIMTAFNKNGLAIFLLANLLTGAVNLSIPTLDVSTIQAMAVLIGYAAVLTGVALGLEKANIKLTI